MTLRAQEHCSLELYDPHLSSLSVLKRKYLKLQWRDDLRDRSPNARMDEIWS